MRIGYADPPYPGQAKHHYGDHPDYAGEVDHEALARRLADEFDGWVLHTASTTLERVLDDFANAGVDGFRIMAWVKPFAAFKRNVSVAYAWEPVLVKACRKPVVSGRMVMRDFLSEGITMQRGLAGAKPERVCHWLFEVVGAEPTDELVDLFPGSGAVSRAWSTWGQQLREVSMCPNDPPCPHAALLHDIEDYDDPSPMCCVEGCDCGQPSMVQQDTLGAVESGVKNDDIADFGVPEPPESLFKMCGSFYEIIRGGR
jgi:hypothetical protein